MKQLMLLTTAVAAVSLTTTFANAWGIKVPNIEVPQIEVPKVELPKVPTIEQVLPQNLKPSYRTNKFDLKKKVEDGGWVLAWGQDISETDAARGVVAAGVSVFSGGSSFMLWVTELVDRQITSIQKSSAQRFTADMRARARDMAAQVIMAAIQGKQPQWKSLALDTVDFKAGAIKYAGGNYVGNKQIGPATWGMKVYMGYRLRNSRTSLLKVAACDGANCDD